jgi:hypothetical protein
MSKSVLKQCPQWIDEIILIMKGIWTSVVNGA